MRALWLATCFWPGLPRLWMRGSWSSLAIAVAFGAALNLVLVSSFIWPELLPVPILICAWTAVAGFGCFSAVRSYHVLPDLMGAARVGDRGLFIRAQGEYLKGHWYEAETLLQQLLHQSPRDVDAGLMLATLYRHTRRYRDANQSLERLERIDGAERWDWEIARERQLNEQAAQSAAEEHQGPDVRIEEATGNGTTKAAS